MADKLLFEEETFAIIGAAIEVWKTLGYGYLEKVYEKALAIELRERQSQVGQQVPVKVR